MGMFTRRCYMPQYYVLILIVISLVLLYLFFILIVIIIIGAPPKRRLTHETDGCEITEPFEVRDALIPRATT